MNGTHISFVPLLEKCLVVEREAVRMTQDKRRKEKSTRTREDGHSDTEVHPVPNLAPKGSL